MTSHARDPRGITKVNTANVSDRILVLALCGRCVPSWAFQPANECGCSQCRDAAARKG